MRASFIGICWRSQEYLFNHEESRKLINLTLADFIDIASRTGVSKTNTIIRIRERPPYQPAFDFYKQIRDHIIGLHQNNMTRNSLLDPRNLTSDNRKWDAYDIIIEQYKAFWGRKKPIWFSPPKNEWSTNNVSVLLNPELGLIINDVPYVIKLYMKGEKLSKAKSLISLFLMHQTLPVNYNKTPIMYCILDVRQNNLIKTSGFPNNILSSLIAETAYINSIWNSNISREPHVNTGI